MLWVLASLMVQTAQAQVAAAPCPERAAVLAELATLSEVQDDFAAAVQLTDREDGTWLVLGPAGDRDLRERRLATEGDCAQRARVAAVVLAAWGADLRGPLMPPGLRLPVEPQAPVTPIPLAAPRARREKSLELALMVRPTTPQTLGVSLGGRFTLVPSWERVGVRLQLGAHAPARTELTADAAASWSRAFAALSPSLRVLASPRAHVYVETGVAAALVIARGEDVMTTRRDQAPDFALQGGLHADLFLFGSQTNWALGLDVRAFRWGGNTLEISGAPSGRLPTLEVLAAMGLAVVWR